MEPNTLNGMNPSEQQLKNRLLAFGQDGTQSNPVSSSSLPTGGTGSPFDSAPSYNPQTIMNKYAEARKLTEESSGATAKRIESEYGTAVEDTNISDTKALTSTLEGQRGFAQMPVALNYMQVAHDKRIRDLTKQKNELLLSNDSERAKSLSDLILKEETAISGARTNFLNEYFKTTADKRAQESLDIQKAEEARKIQEAPILQQKALADLDLTKAQTKKAIAEANKSVASGQLSATSNAVIANPAVYSTLTPTQKGVVAAELTASGYDTTALTIPKLTGEQTQKLDDYDTLEREAKSAQSILEGGLKTGLLDTPYQKGKQLFGKGKEYTLYNSSISNLSSILLRARSGAAVTPQEYDRIKGFIPEVTDDETTAQTKIKRFFEELELAKENYRKRITETPQKVAGFGSLSKMANPPTSGLTSSSQSILNKYGIK